MTALFWVALALVYIAGAIAASGDNWELAVMVIIIGIVLMIGSFLSGHYAVAAVTFISVLAYHSSWRETRAGR